jgi:hypothetical protein
MTLANALQGHNLAGSNLMEPPLTPRARVARMSDWASAKRLEAGHVASGQVGSKSAGGKSLRDSLDGRQPSLSSSLLCSR